MKQPNYSNYYTTLDFLLTNRLVKLRKNYDV